MDKIEKGNKSWMVFLVSAVTVSRLVPVSFVVGLFIAAAQATLSAPEPPDNRATTLQGGCGGPVCFCSHDPCHE